MKFIRKIILWDFIQIIRKREDLNFLEKIRLYLYEYVHKGIKIVIRNYALHKGKNFEEFIEDLRKKEKLEEVPCNLCGSTDLEDVGEKLGFTVVECSQCGLRFTNPRPNKKAREMLYGRRYYSYYQSWLGQKIKSESAIQERLLGEQQLRNILVYKTKGRFLDIGCSTGKLLYAAQKRGFECWGVEPNEWAREFATKKRGLRVINKELQRLSFASSFFDVVSCMEVIEHIPDPLGALQEVNKILKNDGVLVLSTPNFGCTDSQACGMNWKHNRPWEHIYLFDYVHLGKMIDLAGFRVIDVKTELSDGVGYPGGLFIIARKKGYKNKKRSPKILLIRERARGDILLATPVIRALRQKYPHSQITFKTDFPEILNNNPYLNRVITNKDNREYDLIYNLRYELFPEIPYIDAYGKIARVEVKNPQLEFFLTKEEREDVHKLFNSTRVKNRDRLAVVHPMVGKGVRSWDEEKYQDICNYFQAINFKVITIGNPIDTVELLGTVNLIGKSSIRHTAGVMSEADIFVGLDSFPMHLANAFGIPSVVLFGSSDPYKVVCNTKTMFFVRSEEKCLKCRHNTTPDKWAQVFCPRERLYCMENISSQQVIDAIDTFISRGKKR